MKLRTIMITGAIITMSVIAMPVTGYACSGKATNNNKSSVSIGKSCNGAGIKVKTNKSSVCIGKTKNSAGIKVETENSKVEIGKNDNDASVKVETGKDKVEVNDTKSENVVENKEVVNTEVKLTSVESSAKGSQYVPAELPQTGIGEMAGAIAAGFGVLATAATYAVQAIRRS